MGRITQQLFTVSTLVFLVFSLLPSFVSAAPKSGSHALKIVRQWLFQAPNPLDSNLPMVIGKIDTYNDDSGSPLYYIVNTKPQGIIIVAADDLIEPIIGFFPNAASYSPSPDHPLGALVSKDLAGRMEKVRENSRKLNENKIKKDSLPKKQKKARNKWDYLLAASPPDDLVEAPLPDSNIDDIWVAPIVQSQWNQKNEGYEATDYCYNYYTPNHYYSGCVSTAMAQLMRYHQHPQTGVGTGQFDITVDGASQIANLRGGDGAGGPYNWSDMILDPPGSSTTTAQRQAIGALVYDAGVSVNMQYTSGGSSASLQTATTSLTSTFGYSNGIRGANYDYDSSEWLNLTEKQIEKMINSNIDAGYPVILGISRPGGGHAIIADGYGVTSATVYHHLNLGWGGYDDGWYNMPDIQTTNYNYNVVYIVVYNIYTQGSGEVISGRIVDSEGNPVEAVTVTGMAEGTPFSDTTDSRGIFALTKVPSVTSFSISASKEGFHFSPAQQDVSTNTSENSYTDLPVSGNVWGVNFSAALDIKGDIDKSGQVNLIDTILALQILSGISPTIAIDINSNIDVNTDQRIGLEEAIYVLQQAAAN